MAGPTPRDPARSASSGRSMALPVGHLRRSPRDSGSAGCASTSSPKRHRCSAPARSTPPTVGRSGSAADHGSRASVVGCTVSPAKTAMAPFESAADGSGLQWGVGLVLPFAFDERNPYHWWAAWHVGEGRLRFCRIVRARIRGRWAYAAQLVLDGTPLQRYQ